MLKNAESGAEAGRSAPGPAVLKLGLIGDHIAQSKAPLLHRLAGRLAGIEASYERLVPREIGADFDAVFAACAGGGYRGVNVTYPYKERAARRVRIDDPLIRSMGAVNTVIFETAGARGYNTDYSGFIAAYRNARGAAPAGSVCLIGAGGVGKAIAFALLKLGVGALWILDLDRPKAEDLAARIAAAAPALPVALAESPEALPGGNQDGIQGLVNCTPVGMVGHAGTPLPRRFMRGAGWAFDAVYTPLETQFLRDAAAGGLTTISGYELFFHQGVDAWRHFAGCPVDAAELRRRLAAEGGGPED